MNHRPYPNADRARHQVERGRAPEPTRCPVCDHHVSRHALEDGQPVCTRGKGPVSCQDCAELWARMPAVAAMAEFGRTLRHGTARLVLVDHPRRAGKSAAAAAAVDQAVKAGRHVHVAGGGDGIRCAGGDEACSLPRKNPIVLARVVQTCITNPSQWNAWTVDGKYLYLRYRFGVGIVSTTPHFRTRPLVRFEYGGQYAGAMRLAEFCEHAGLRLAGDAEVTGQ
ncbi:hypothetical protein ACIOC2_19305 [Streptomyces sp. NPDC088337]|uniref:hypothetical protein n=1 Tax=unclassified Streptomyces TaxID=2593676 RepID=UPI0037F42AFB